MSYLEPLSESAVQALGQADFRRRRSSAVSVSTHRSRLESETDFGDWDDEAVRSPRPQHQVSPLLNSWLRNSGPQLQVPELNLGDRKSGRTVSGRTSGNLQRKVVKVTPVRRWTRELGTLGHPRSAWAIMIGCLVLFRMLVAFGGHSGRADMPRFGDLEAQRHWMELALHTPVEYWYFYDLKYWGLDYPPLTALHSLGFAYIGHFFNSSWFDLARSRGTDTVSSTFFMRFSVLLSDLACFLPAVGTYCLLQDSRSSKGKNASIIIICLQPAFILIDYGHFQYNNVMLGLVMWAVTAFGEGQSILGGLFFILSICFKQMALYFSPAIFALCLSECLQAGFTNGLKLFIGLGLTVLSATGLVFAPLISAHPTEIARQIVVRMFPFERGLFEDKVANFWCFTNVALKWKQSSKLGHWLPQLAIGLTVAGFVVPIVHLGVENFRSFRQSKSAKRTTNPLLLAMFNCSMSFFLFSFQVHEKSILLPMLPICVLASFWDHAPFQWSILFMNTALFSLESLQPLLLRDGQMWQCLALSIVWNYVIGYKPWLIRQPFLKWLSLSSYATMLLMLLAQVGLNPPRRFPDLYPVLNVLLCTPIFVIFWLWAIQHQLRGEQVGPEAAAVSKRTPQHLAASNIKDPLKSR